MKPTVAVLALESVAEQVTRVRPTLNQLPERGLQSRTPSPAAQAC